MSKNKDFTCSVTKHNSPLVETEIRVATVSGPDGGVWLHAAGRGWVLAVMIEGLMFRVTCEAKPKARGAWCSRPWRGCSPVSSLPMGG